MADQAFGQVQYLLTIDEAGGGVENRLDYFRLNQSSTQWFYWFDGSGLTRGGALPTISGATFVDVVGSLNDWILLDGTYIFPNATSGALAWDSVQPPGAGITLPDITLNSVLNASTNILTFAAGGMPEWNITPLVSIGANQLTVSGGAIFMDYDNRWWPGHLRTILNTRTNIALDNQVLGGHLASSFGTIVMNNDDGQFDETATLSLQDNTLTVYRGLSGTSQFPADFQSQLLGVVRDIEADTEQVRITARDRGNLFRKQVLTDTYGGTGGLDGDAGAAGQLRPLALGEVRQILPVLIDASNQIYQFNTGGVTTNASEVRDRENLLVQGIVDNVVGIFPPAPAPGLSVYNINLTDGLMRLGSVPVGPVTMRLIGASNLTFPSDIIQALALRAGFPAGSIDAAAFAAFNAQYFTPAGIYIRDEVSYEDAMTSLITGSAWYVEPQTGLLRVVQITKSAPVYTITEDQLTEKTSIRRLSLPIAPSQVRLGHSRAWHVFDQQLTPEFLYETAINPAPLAGADETLSNTAYSNPAFVQTEATRQLSLWLTQRNHFSVTIRVPAVYQPRIGDTVTLQHSRFGLVNGIDMIIMGVDQLAATQQRLRESYTLRLWG